MVTTVATKSSATATPAANFAFAFPSELGWMAVAWNGRFLTRMRFGHANANAAMESFDDVAGWAMSLNDVPTNIRTTVARLQRFAAGSSDDFADVELELSHCTEFQHRVINACRAISAGQVKSYAELAVVAGSPRAARAVGNVMRSNRFPLIVPCHRVIGTSGKLCGFTSPQGLAMKERLLQREGGWPQSK